MIPIQFWDGERCIASCTSEEAYAAACRLLKPRRIDDLLAEISAIGQESLSPEESEKALQEMETVQQGQNDAADVLEASYEQGRELKDRLTYSRILGVTTAAYPKGPCAIVYTQGKPAEVIPHKDLSVEDEITKRVNAQRQAWVEHGATMARDAIAKELDDRLSDDWEIVVAMPLAQLLKGGGK